MLENQKEGKQSLKRVAVVVFISTLILGGFAIIDIHIMGVVPTYERVLIPIIFFCFFIIRVKEGFCQGQYGRLYWIFLGFFIVWLCWGGVFLMIGEYVDLAKGLRDLLAIGLGLLAIFVIYEIVHMEKGLKILINTIRVIIMALTIFAIWEMATGKHLPGSKFCDPQYVDWAIERIGREKFNGIVSYSATTIFYNINDFAAFIGLFTPIFFPHKGYSKKINSIFIVELSLILLVLSQNDAWICIFSILLGTLAYMLLTRPKIWVWVVGALGFGLIKMYGINTFYFLEVEIYKLLGKIPPTDIVGISHQGGSKLNMVIEGQMEGVAAETGSAFTRITTYLGSLKSTFVETFGLGFGPGSFSNYMTPKESLGMLANPHCFWVELIFQYGVLITITFIGLILYCFIKLLVKHHKTQRTEYALLIAMDVIFVFICFAPSGYIGYTYMWIPIGLSLAFAHSTKLPCLHPSILQARGNKKEGR